MQITVYQGSDHHLDPSQVNVVIDVLRAFTVAHYAFLLGAKEIWLVNTVDSAYLLKQQHPDILLAGEVKGLPIKGFDLDNSPAGLLKNASKLSGKTLVQKTTNGVKAALNALQADEIYVTGFSNAKTTAEFIKTKWSKPDCLCRINIIASHPVGDDDLACAEYIKDILEGTNTLTVDEIKHRIKHSSVAEKFLDPLQEKFNPADLDICTKELDSSFVMRINKTRDLPTIERVVIL